MLKLQNEVSEDLSDKIRQLRKVKKLSQQQLANKSGVSLGSLKRFERTSQISLESLLKIAMVLGRLNDFDQLFQPQDELPAT
ncbi:MAG: helix-turn-helix transcriptional regulator [Cytophagales bacterium]|nr:helix-turn-helix transcriptional regulator [Cytophagales bacterium]